MQRIRIRCIEDSLTHLYHNIQTLGLTQSQYSSSELSSSNQSSTSQLHARNSLGPSSSAATGAGFELESGSTSRKEATDDRINVEARSDGQLKEVMRELQEVGKSWIKSRATVCLLQAWFMPRLRQMISKGLCKGGKMKAWDSKKVTDQCALSLLHSPPS